MIEFIRRENVYSMFIIRRDILELVINKTNLNGMIDIPSDKSISHRSIMFGAIAQGKTTIKNFLRGDDCLSTLQAFKDLGVKIEDDGETITVHGTGFSGLKKQKKQLMLEIPALRFV